MSDLAFIRREINQMCADLLEFVDATNESMSELERQVLAAFCFGMTYAFARSKSLPPADVHALALLFLEDVFRYSSAQASAFADDLIASSSGGGNPTTNAIIHRGIDGLSDLKAGNLDRLFANISGIYQSVGLSQGPEA